MSDKDRELKLKPKANCKDCRGRGFTLRIDPNLDATKFRVARPCHCVKAIVVLNKEEEKCQTN